MFKINLIYKLDKYNNYWRDKMIRIRKLINYKKKFQNKSNNLELKIQSYSRKLNKYKMMRNLSISLNNKSDSKLKK